MLEPQPSRSPCEQAKADARGLPAQEGQTSPTQRAWGLKALGKRGGRFLGLERAAAAQRGA